jgi:hypothetical protein
VESSDFSQQVDFDVGTRFQAQKIEALKTNIEEL